jgi:hypothetical protein
MGVEKKVLSVGVFLPPASKIEQIVECRSRGCEYQDEHKDLYWFGLSGRNTLRPV